MKIDSFSCFEKRQALRPEQSWALLQSKLKDFADRPEYQGLVDNEAKVLMSGPEADFDEQVMNIKQEAWAKESGKTIEEWKRKKELNQANLAEMGVTLLLDRVLGKEFMVVRSTDYDDYENSVDNFIIDRASGAVVCGVDEVWSSERDKGPSIKEKKTRDKMNKGGVQLKYGLALNTDSGQLTPRRLRNLPIFYSSLNSSELESLVTALSSDDQELKPEALLIYKKLVESISEQHTYFLENCSLDGNLDPKLLQRRQSLMKNLHAFTASLTKMRGKYE